MKNLFDLTGKTALITGGGGLLGPKHAEAIIEYGGKVILADWHEDRAKENAEKLGPDASYEYIDVTDKKSIQAVVDKYDNIDILINNAAKDPKVKKGGGLTPDSRFETMTEEYWKEGIDACMNGTFLCSQIVSNKMLENGGGVILNISSDLGVIAPDQRLYMQEGIDENMQNVKPITYSAAKWAVVGMTKYLGVYFAKKNIRVNCLSPTGVYNNHPEDFVKKLSNIIPMGRMADIDEYKGAIVFLCSNASSYMTGENLIIDGGKTVW
jgi:NAD(P)-dependent dehydrogenase (short-subunit alcohol dehydrogenase family)